MFTYNFSIMKTTFFMTLLGAATLFTSSVQAQNTTDESGVWTLIQKGVDAFNAHDATAFANLYTENADFIPPMGGVLHGREQIRVAHENLFKMIPKPAKSTLEKKDEKVRFLTSDLILASGRWITTDTYPDGKSETSEMAFTMLLRRSAGQWLAELTTLTPAVPMPGQGK